MSRGAEIVEQLARIESVWQLSSEQVEQVYHFGHMNNYVRAALRVLADSAWPRGGSWRSATSSFGAAFDERVDALLAFVSEPADKPRERRVAITEALYRLYDAIPVIGPAEVSELTRIFAALAFLPLLAERADSFPLWWHPPRRAIGQRQRRFFAMLSAETLSLEQIFEREKAEFINRDVSRDDPVTLLFAITIDLVQSVIVMLENGVFADLALVAYQRIEAAMRDFEQRHGLADAKMPLGLRSSGQLRYRNTLYLYGGSLLERMGRRDAARAWYLRDIDRPELSERISFYLTGFKTCERLLAAHRVAGFDCGNARVGHATTCRSKDGASTSRAQIDATLAASLMHLKRYAKQTLDFVAEHPELDRGSPKLELGDKTMLYAGEGAREPLLIALLYQNIVGQTPFSEIDYSIFSEA